MEFKHISVLKNEAIEGLLVKTEGIYVDGTMGGAGHSLAIAEKLGNQGQLIAIDQDIHAVNAGRKVLAGFPATIVHDNFTNIKTILQQNHIRKIDGVLLDLGVSSYQLDEGARGFSYNTDAPLDMRMDERQVLSAREVVNTFSENELSRIIAQYGEENWARRIASFIVKSREKKEIATTFDLVEIIKNAIPKGARKEGPHPAKRTFQAIRIVVNNELSILENTIFDGVSYLNHGGRFCIITFHSLEDRIVKQVFKKLQDPCECPPAFPVCMCGKKPQGKIVTRKPILPGADELLENPRARSAKLRIFEKTEVL